MGELEIDDLIFPTMGRDLPSLLQVVLGVLATTANRWCVFEKSDLQFLLKPILFRNQAIRFEFSSWRFILFFRLCLALCKMFFEYKIFSGENILHKGKHFLLFNYVVEIMPKNYFLCLALHVKK